MKSFVKSIVNAEGLEKDPNTGQVESAGRLRSFGVNVCRRGLQTLKSVDASFFILRLLSIALLLWCRQCWKNNTPLISQTKLNDLSWSVMDEKTEIGDGNKVGTATFAFDEAADVKTKSVIPLFINDESSQKAEACHRIPSFSTSFVRCGPLS
ncbi:hypothetical protein BLNAU_954 [Blattamonas nauphoetae]|uniref:Uncharacterized protein n=1 Tax=Blattamonas nauphoetae TaxID=2049346 RepID=A0ABQ9YJD9_9EUKA|nr:hypothetical protein BLNAU_954 [Blattamonas nauphoetae]